MEEKKEKVEVGRSNFFFGSQREIVLEGIWDLEQASCARIGVFLSSLEEQTTWFRAGGRQLSLGLLLCEMIPLLIKESAKWALHFEV